jgi:hypothetical protein
MAKLDTWQPVDANAPASGGHAGYPAADAATSNPGPEDTPATEAMGIMQPYQGANETATHTGG